MRTPGDRDGAPVAGLDAPPVTLEARGPDGVTLLANEPDALVNVEGTQPRRAQRNLLGDPAHDPAQIPTSLLARACRRLQATRVADGIGAVAGMATAAQLAHLASNLDDAPAALGTLYALGATLSVASIVLVGRDRPMHRAIASAAHLSLVTANSIGLLVWQLRAARGPADSASEHAGVDTTAAVTWAAATAGTATHLAAAALQRRSSRIHARPLGPLVRSQGLHDLAVHARDAAMPARLAWDNLADELAAARAPL